MFITISRKEELLKKEGEIRHLFLAAFGREISSDFWQWSYIDVPSGDPVVSLYYEEGELLGHYGAVPIKMRGSGEQIITYRSMTSMVHPKGQGKGLFVELGKKCYIEMRKNGVPLVFGFPNLQALPGRKKYLDWKILKPDLLTDFLGSEILSSRTVSSMLLKEGGFHWDYGDRPQFEWRTSAPGVKYQIYPGLVLKEYQGVWNVLHIAREGLQYIDPDKVYRVLVDSSMREQITRSKTSFDYFFGFRAFDPAFGNASFKRELILSDVF